MKHNSAAISRSSTEESVTRLAVEENRRPNIMGAFGPEEGRALERVVILTDSLGCRDVTLKSDMEPAVNVFRFRVAEVAQS